jgi:hypothetical protein
MWETCLVVSDTIRDIQQVPLSFLWLAYWGAIDAEVFLAFQRLLHIFKDLHVYPQTR